ncbi:MAG: NUDIX domain-containing protein [Microbacteriaceae bacterium]
MGDSAARARHAHSSGAPGISLAISTVIFALRRAEASEPSSVQQDGTREQATGLMTVWLPLVRRIRNPYRGQWALPGGPLGADEDLAGAAGRTLNETTRLTPKYLEQLYAFGGVDRSPAAESRVVSIVYWALVQSDEADRVSVGENVRWFPADDLPALAFDHNIIADYALWRLRNKMEYSRIAHSFLGDTFTLAQLREVHEAVLGKPLDPANFRRMIEASDTLVATGQRLTGTRHRPPRLYRYNTEADATDQGPIGPLPPSGV